MTTLAKQLWTHYILACSTVKEGSAVFNSRWRENSGTGIPLSGIWIINAHWNKLDLFWCFKSTLLLDRCSLCYVGSLNHNLTCEIHELLHTATDTWHWAHTTAVLCPNISFLDNFVLVLSLHARRQKITSYRQHKQPEYKQHRQNKQTPTDNTDKTNNLLQTTQTKPTTTTTPEWRWVTPWITSRTKCNLERRDWPWALEVAEWVEFIGGTQSLHLPLLWPVHDSQRVQLHLVSARSNCINNTPHQQYYETSLVSLFVTQYLLQFCMFMTDFCMWPGKRTGVGRGFRYLFKIYLGIVGEFGGSILIN